MKFDVGEEVCYPCRVCGVPYALFLPEAWDDGEFKCGVCGGITEFMKVNGKWVIRKKDNNEVRGFE